MKKSEAQIKWEKNSLIKHQTKKLIPMSKITRKRHPIFPINMFSKENVWIQTFYDWKTLIEFIKKEIPNINEKSFKNQIYNQLKNKENTKTVRTYVFKKYSVWEAWTT